MSTTRQPTATDLHALLDAVARELDLYCIDNQSGAALREAAIALARALGMLRKQDISNPALPRVQELSRAIWNAGCLGQPVSADDLSLASQLLASGWPGLLGAMLFTPCWQWTGAPKLDEVPERLWSHYVDWVFVPPDVATASGAADDHLRKLETLAETVQGWATRNLGAACVKGAVETFERHRGDMAPLRSTLPLRRWAAARTAISSRFHRYVKEFAAAPAAASRFDRPLKIGVLRPDWGESIEVRALLPRLTALDPDRFAIHLFAERLRYDAMEKACRELAAGLEVLPAELLERIGTLRAAKLDVLVFGGSLSDSAVRMIALHRIAPLQVVTDECPATTGLPEIDLHLTGVNADPEEFTEALGLLPAPGFVWDADTAHVVFESQSRANLGLPATGPVFVSAPRLEHLSPETLQAWAGLLRANPTSSLLLLLPPDSDTFALEQIFNRLQATAGLESNRCLLALGDPRATLPHGDVYLDTYPFSAPTPLLAALAAGLPAVAWEGATHRARTGATLLRALGQSDWVAADAAGYIDRAQRLLRDETLRAGARSSLHLAVERRRGFADAPFASLCFGDLLTHAFDLAAAGRRLPKSLSLPAPALAARALADLAAEALARGEAAAAAAHAGAFLHREPESASALSLLGRAHLLAGHAGLAVACFFSALRGHEGEAQAWLNLGAGLRAQKETGNAMKAYTAGLRIDSKPIEGWIALAELARESGENELAEDAIGVARRINRRDPRLAAFAS
jgi:Tfp pilus assembly protein PilF